MIVASTDLDALRAVADRIEALHNNASACLSSDLGKLTADRCAIEADAVRIAIVEIERLRERAAKFARLLNPVWMQLAYAAMAEKSPDDSVRIFNFMGGGGSGFSTFGEFRELMGDEREAVAAAEGHT